MISKQKGVVLYSSCLLTGSEKNICGHLPKLGTYEYCMWIVLLLWVILAFSWIEGRETVWHSVGKDREVSGGKRLWNVAGTQGQVDAAALKKAFVHHTDLRK
jgi:hypothetical protein